MDDGHTLEYFLLQYVPNIVRSDVFNIAVVLLDPKDPDRGFCGLRCVSNWQSKVLAMDPDADISVLGSMLEEIFFECALYFRAPQIPEQQSRSRLGTVGV